MGGRIERLVRRITCAIILCLRTFSLSRILMATFSPVSTFRANLTLAKVPSPRVRPSSYRPTRVLPTDTLIFPSLNLDAASRRANEKRRGLDGAAGSGSVKLPATRPSARGLRPLCVAGPPLHEQLLALLALLPLPHQDSFWCLSAGPAAAGMGWDDDDWPGD
jgi:hypothetical protein